MLRQILGHLHFRFVKLYCNNTTVIKIHNIQSFLCMTSTLLNIYCYLLYSLLLYSVKKAEHWKIDSFELWCWRRLLRVPWTARRSNQSILKEISPGCSLEGLMLKLKLQTLATWCKELTHWKSPWCWDGLAAGGEGDNRGWDGWMASPTLWTWVWVDSGNWWWTGRPGVLWFMGSQRVRHDWVTELNWTELIVLSRVQLFVTLWTITCQALLSMEFPRQDYWVGCHFLLQGVLPTQG